MFAGLMFAWFIARLFNAWANPFQITKLIVITPSIKRVAAVLNMPKLSAPKAIPNSVPGIISRTMRLSHFLK